MMVASMIGNAQNQVIALQHEGETSFYYDGNPSLGVIVADYALAGDTIYLPGGLISTGGFDVNKQLTFVGAGMLNSGTPVTNPTTIAYSFGEDINIQANGNGSSFHGIDIARSIRFFGGVTNISFTRCKLSLLSLGVVGFPAATNVHIKHCVLREGISHSGNAGPQGLWIDNCIIAEGINFGQTFISGAYVTQCILLDPDIIEQENPGVRYTNCIFARTGSYAVNSASSYYNNLFTLSNGGTLTWGTAPTDGGGNQAYQGNVFVNFGSFSEWNENYDYHLDLTNPENPAWDMGIDDDQVGIYGGAPGNAWKENAIPFNPHWQRLLPQDNLGTTNGGVINVTLQGAAQQD